MTPDELTFIAEEEHISIVPFFSMTKVRLLSVGPHSAWPRVLFADATKGIYGPFTPPSAANVPLWLAISLKRKRKCRIVPPEWFTVGEWMKLRIPMRETKVEGDARASVARRES